MTVASAAWTAAVVVVALATSGCTGTPEDETRDVVVSAAASLSDAFSNIEAAFERAHPEFDVLLNVAGSSALREQILEGAPADVFASADQETMGDVVAGGDVATSPQTFALNSMAIAVPAGNPAEILGLSDFGRHEVFVGLCAESVPCGSFARQILAKAGVEPSIDTNETDVRSLVLKIGLGEIDVGIVYVTDVRAAGAALEPVELPDEHNVIAEYPIALLAGAPNRQGGEAFISFVMSDEGVAIMNDHGFGTP